MARRRDTGTRGRSGMAGGSRPVALPRPPGLRAGIDLRRSVCGPNPHEQPRTGANSVPRGSAFSGGFSPVFAFLRGSLRNRGEGFRLALLSHFSAFCGPFAVQIPIASQPVPAALASLALRRRPESAECRFGGEAGAVARGRHLLKKGRKTPSAVHAGSER